MRFPPPLPRPLEPKPPLCAPTPAGAPGRLGARNSVDRGRSLDLIREGPVNRRPAVAVALRPSDNRQLVAELRQISSKLRISLGARPPNRWEVICKQEDTLAHSVIAWCWTRSVGSNVRTIVPAPRLRRNTPGRLRGRQRLHRQRLRGRPAPRTHDHVLAEPSAIADLHRPDVRNALVEDGSAGVIVGVNVVRDVHARAMRTRSPMRIELAADSTQLPAMLVPAPISRAISSPPGCVWSQEFAPTNTSLPTTIRRSPPIRIGGSRTVLRPNEPNAPPTESENAFA